MRLSIVSSALVIAAAAQDQLSPEQWKVYSEYQPRIGKFTELPAWPKYLKAAESAIQVWQHTHTVKPNPIASGKVLEAYEGLVRDIEFAATQTYITSDVRESLVSVASEFLDAIVDAAPKPTESGDGGDVGNRVEGRGEKVGDLDNDRGGFRTHYYPYKTMEDGPEETGLYPYVHETEEEGSATKTITSAVNEKTAAATTGISAKISTAPTVSSAPSEIKSEVPAVSEQPTNAAVANGAASSLLLGAVTAGMVAVVGLL